MLHNLFTDFSWLCYGMSPVDTLNQTIASLTDQQKLIIRLVLSGASVIDRFRLHLDSLNAVDRFLGLNEFDWTRKEDEKHLQAILNEAVDYIETQLKLSLAPEIKDPNQFRQLFLIASERPHRNTDLSSKSDPPLPMQACAVLKVMNVIHRTDGHELLYNCPLNRRELAKCVDDKMERELSRLKRSGFPIISCKGGRKPKESLVTKLLCKKSKIASRVNDRLRYQIVVKEKKDIVRLLVELFENVLPFNCVLPGSTINQLIDPKLFLTSPELVPHKARDVADSIARSVSYLMPHSWGEVSFSGKSYRVLKFIVDIPVRLDSHTAKMATIHAEQFGRIVYSLLEIQVVDEETEAENQKGENAHEEYKVRQKRGTTQRIIGGDS